LFDSLKKLFRNTENNLNKSFDDLQLLSGLMIEAANIDGIIDQKEINKISKSLVEIFGEKPQAVEIELNKCLDEINDHKSLHFYTSSINQTYTEEKKIIIIEILWEIILEDGKIHDFETNLIRRLAGLLYISDTQCGKAKKKILEKFQIKD